MPKAANLRLETAMEEMKQKILGKVDEYLLSKCDDKGYPKSNLTQNEKKGMADVEKKIANKEVVPISKTSQCGSTYQKSPRNSS